MLQFLSPLDSIDLKSPTWTSEALQLLQTERVVPVEQLQLKTLVDESEVPLHLEDRLSERPCWRRLVPTLTGQPELD